MGSATLNHVGLNDVGEPQAKGDRAADGGAVDGFRAEVRWKESTTASHLSCNPPYTPLCNKRV